MNRAVQAAARTRLRYRHAQPLQKHHSNVLDIASTYQRVAARTYNLIVARVSGGYVSPIPAPPIEAGDNESYVL